MSDVGQPLKTKHETCEENYWITSSVISAIALLSAIVAAVLSGLAYSEAQKQAAAAINQASAAIDYNRKNFPAKLIVSNVESYIGSENNEVLDFKAGQNFKIVGFIENIGRERAIANDAPEGTKCFVYWHRGTLPMFRPYLGKTVPCGNNWMEKGNGSPGDTLRVEVEVVTPRDYRPGMTLYFMGWVQYRDAVSNGLFTLFARCFAPSLGRFVPVDNPDYENEDEKEVGKRRDCRTGKAE